MSTTTIEDKKKKLEAQMAALDKLAEEQAAKELEKQEKEAEKAEILKDLAERINNQKLVFQDRSHTTYAENLLIILKSNIGDEENPIYIDPVYAENCFWKYEPTVGSWVALLEEGPNSIATLIKKFRGMLVQNYKTETRVLINTPDIAATIKNATYDIKKPKFFSNEGLSCGFLNGYLQINKHDMELVPHDPEHKCRFYNEFDYNPDANPVKFIEFLHQVFQDDEDKEDKITLLRQYLGACLLGRATKYESCVILYGESGSNGKSTFLKIVGAVVPSAFSASLSPVKWDEKFSIGMLKGKRINFVSELPEDKTLKSNIVKEVISGDRIKAEDKGKDPYEFSPVCGHIFSCNEFPDVSDFNEAFWKRLTVITFNRKFEKSEQKKDLHKEIIAEKEDIINWCIKGYEDVLVNKKLIHLESSDQALREWKKDTQTVLRFLDDCCSYEKDKNSWMKASDLFDSFKTYCNTNKNIPTTMNKFTKNIRKHNKLTTDECIVGGQTKLPYKLKEDNSGIDSIQSISRELNKQHNYDDTKVYCGVSDTTIKYLASKIESDSEDDEIKKRWFKEVINSKGEEE